MVKYNIDIYMKTAIRNIVDPPRINLVSNDYNGNVFDFTIHHNNREIFNLTGKRVTLIVKSPTGAVVQDFCTITAPTEGKATITLKKSMFQEQGEYYVELQVFEGQNRVTSSPFNYTVRKSLDVDEIVVTTNEFSALQEALDNIDRSNAIANTALSTANSAKAIADDLVPEITQASIDANNALDRALSVVTQADLAEKVKIDGNPQNVNFIENQIVQDGLVKQFSNNTNLISDETSQITPINKLDINFYFIAKDNSGTYTDHQIINFGDTFLSVRRSDMRTIRLPNGKTATLDYQILDKQIKVRYCDDGVKTRVFIDDKLIAEEVINYTYTTVKLVKTRNYYSGCCVYNRILTSQEIQQNFSILNNSKSINKINGYTISTDTDHIQDRTGRVQDTINRVFYKQNCKEFTSDGGDITVNNGLEGYVLSATLQGNTIKNYASIKTTSHTVTSFEHVLPSTIPNGTKVTARYNISSNTGEKFQGIFVLKNSANQTVGTFFDTYTFSEYGEKSVTTTTTGDATKLLIWRRSDPVTPTTYTFSNINIIEGDATQVPIGKFLPFGLNSTQAVISNLGMKYSFYKDSVDKASDTVLTLGGVGVAYDTLEIKEDGSGIYTQNTKEMVLNGSENWGIHASIPNLFFTIYDTALNMKATDSIMMVSDKYTATTYYPTSNNSISGGGASNPNRFAIKDESCATASDLKSKLASNNVTVRYQLATPIVATIPKEIMPTVLTQLQTQIVFGDAVKPSSVMIKIPTTDDVSKSYTQTLLNGYIQTVGTATPIVNLLNNGIVRLQMDLTAPTTLLNATIFAVAPELRPLTSAKIPIFVNGVCVLGTVDKTTGNVNLPSVPSASANIYIKTDYRRDI